MSVYSASILGCSGPKLTQSEHDFFRDAQPFGFIVFARNIETADQLRRLTNDLRAAVGWDAPVLVDQEGGRVQRLRPPLATEWLPPLDDVARFGTNATRAMYLRYRITAAELRAVGIDANCAPMLDIARGETHAFLKNRCYANTLQDVVDVGISVAQAHLAGGVLPIIKHIPGHGRATFDSHLDLPRVAADHAMLETEDFAAFRPFAEMPLGMTAHLVYEAIDPRPATISPVMIDLIRHQIGFDGFLMTDDISMEALDGTVAQRGAASVAAGCDAVLHCDGDLAEMESLIDAVGQMSAVSQARADRALTWRRTPDMVDLAALKAEFEALLPGPA